MTARGFLSIEEATAVLGMHPRTLAEFLLALQAGLSRRTLGLNWLARNP
jgi:hypothetical protein